MALSLSLPVKVQLYKKAILWIGCWWMTIVLRISTEMINEMCQGESHSLMLTLRSINTTSWRDVVVDGNP